MLFIIIIISTLLRVLFRCTVQPDVELNWRLGQSLIVQPSMHCKPAPACESCSLLLLLQLCSWYKAEAMQLCAQTEIYTQMQAYITLACALEVSYA
jgi:hypothetical protein